MASENNALAIVKDHRDASAMAIGLAAGYVMAPPASLFQPPKVASKLMPQSAPAKDVAIWVSQAQIASGAFNLLMAYLSVDHPKMVGGFTLAMGALHVASGDWLPGLYRVGVGGALWRPGGAGGVGDALFTRKNASSGLFALGGYLVGQGASIRRSAELLPDSNSPVSSTLPTQGPSV